MKTISITLLALILNIAVFSQDSEEFQTIFGSDISISGFGGPFMSFTTINGEFAHMMGGGGGVLLDKNVFFGGYGIGTTTKHLTNYTDPVSNTSFTDLDIEFGHGGFYFGYIIMPERAIHPAIFLQTGWGELNIKDSDINTFHDNVFVLNPSLQLEMNLTRFFRIGVGVNYQYTTGVDLNNFTNEDFSGVGGFLSFKFGWF